MEHYIVMLPTGDWAELVNGPFGGIELLRFDSDEDYLAFRDDNSTANAQHLGELPLRDLEELAKSLYT